METTDDWGSSYPSSENPDMGNGNRAVGAVVASPALQRGVDAPTQPTGVP
jgi:hypothetical protein